MNLNRSNKKAATQIIVLYIIIQLVTAIVPFYFPESSGPELFLTFSIVMFSLGALGMIWIVRRQQMQFDFEDSFSQQRKEILTWGIAGVFIALFVQNIASIIEVIVLNSPMESQNTEQIMQIVSSYPVFLILAGIAGPIMEEFVFRKAIFGMLIDKIGGIGAAVVSSLLFAFIHFDGLLLVYSSMGFVFAWLYYKTKNIWTPIIAHCLMNIMAVVLNLL
ncbi:type II CAAX endopeptidase family protein [Alkalibacterium iburiense]|uniref:Type II CAAX endopeptidase family protein n=1 Tax=Alkalibacterium iburiense TaxID=290589 RepID=A0ABN0X6C3_9LACT